jgi:deoxyribonuclease-4
MGKINQLGTLEEVMSLCSIDERIIPCVDFGHLNARTFGGLKEAEDFARVLDTIHNSLGEERARHFHIHFSKIQYTEKGEVRHLTFEDDKYGPEFPPLALAIRKRGLEPVIVCESAGTQAEDAAEMKRMYFSL